MSTPRQIKTLEYYCLAAMQRVRFSIDQKFAPWGASPMVKYIFRKINNHQFKSLFKVKMASRVLRFGFQLLCKLLLAYCIWIKFSIGYRE